MSRVLWRMLDHRYTRAHASEYLDGQLPEPGRRRIDRHTAVCPHCRALLASLRRVVETLPVLRVCESSLADGVLERLRREA